MKSLCWGLFVVFASTTVLADDGQFKMAPKTTLGGYAELHYNLVFKEGEDDSSAKIDLHRLVIFLGHNFTPKLKFFSEIEVEHAFVGDGRGEVGVEQALVDWQLTDSDALRLRAGIVLVPMGIINAWHEPPVFNGVERPMVDKVIIPTTWREGGIGLAGEPIEGLRYEAYLLSGLNPLGFSAKSGIRGGRQHVAKARTDGLAFAGRVEHEPILGLVYGVSGYYSAAGANSGDEDLDVSVAGVSADVRYKGKGIEARAVFASFFIGGTEDLRKLDDDDGNPIDVASQVMGYYAELGYNVLHMTDSSHALVPFFRFEQYDTGAKFDGDSPSSDNESLKVTDLVFGVSYRPVPQVVFKANAVMRNPGGDDNNTTGLDLGVGLMF